MNKESVITIILILLITNVSLSINSPLFEASSKGKLSEIREYISEGINLNIKNDKGFTALMIACRYNQYEVIKILIKNGAKIEDVSDNGLTAIMIAAAYSDKKIVKFLLKNGADKNRIIQGYNAIKVAEEEKRWDILKILSGRSSVVSTTHSAQVDNSKLFECRFYCEGQWGRSVSKQYKFKVRANSSYEASEIIRNQYQDECKKFPFYKTGEGTAHISAPECE